MLQILGISIHKAADRVGEVQAETDEVMSQLQDLKSRLKSLELIAVYEEPILKQCEEHKVSLLYSILYGCKFLNSRICSLQPILPLTTAEVFHA